MDAHSTNDNATVQGREVSTANYSEPSLCFDPPPIVNRKFPNPKGLPGRFLALLLTGRRYTHLDAWLELGHSRLADSAWKLRKAGWPVQIHEESVATSDCGRPALIGFYYLTPEKIAEAGEDGQRYAVECLRAEAERRAA